VFASACTGALYGKLKMSKISNKEEFIAALKDRGIAVKDVENMWNEFETLSKKMTSCRKEFTFTIEECFVIIEALFVSKISGIGTKIGNDVIEKLSAFFFENELNPPNLESVCDTLERCSVSLQKDIESLFSQASISQNQIEDEFLFPKRKKEKTYLN